MMDYRDGPLCVLLAGIVIGTPIAAVLLKVSCALFNLLAGASGKPSYRPARRAAAGEPETETNIMQEPAPASDEGADNENIMRSPGVPKPSFEWATCIVLFAALVNAVVSFILLRVLRLAGQVAGSGAFGSVSIYLVFSPLSILVLGGLNAAMLPTSLGKGLLVALVFLLLSILIAAILTAVFVFIALVFGLGVTRFV
ncbi:MAG TPA: hypothetical protein VH682_24185 [Gemmataceae bacterium]